MSRRVARATPLVPFLALLILAPSVGAQGQWLITAGQGWGPISLGWTEEAVKGVLGQPDNPHAKPSESEQLDLWNYKGVTLVFFRSDANDFKLSEILITTPQFTTREGIRVGSSLSAVLRAYGDTFDTMNKTTLRSCLNISLQGDRSLSQGLGGADYNNFFLWLRYKDRGIEFQIVPEGQSLYVSKINIADPDSSKCVVSPL